MTGVQNTSSETKREFKSPLQELGKSREDWLDGEFVRIAEADPIYDRTEIDALIGEAKRHGLSLERQVLKKRINELRKAADEAEHRAAGEANHAKFIERMNAQYFVYEGGDKVLIGSWQKTKEGRKLVQRVAQDFRLLLANEPKVFSPNEGQRLPAADAWLRDPNRRAVKGFIFEADPDKAKILSEKGLENLFEGFAVRPADGPIDPFLRHLREVIVADEAPARQDELVDYLLDCFAHLVQRPGVPLRVALVFRGQQGSGKSFVTETIASLFQGNVFATSNAEDIVGRFTGHLLNTCLVIGDEALFAGSKKDADAMKRLITEDKLRIEAKHKDVLNEKNRLSLMLTSNHEHAVRLEAGDRRFFVLDVSDVYTPRSKHAEYWDNLWSWAKSEVGKAALLHSLLARDLSDFDAQRDRPQTRARLDQILASLDLVHRWFLEEVIQADELSKEIKSGLVPTNTLSEETAGQLQDGYEVCRKKAVYEAYSVWERENTGRSQPLDQRMFGKSLQKVLGADFIRKWRVRGQPTPVVVLPPPDICAERFLSALGCTDLNIDLLDAADRSKPVEVGPALNVAHLASGRRKVTIA